MKYLLLSLLMLFLPTNYASDMDEARSAGSSFAQSNIEKVKSDTVSNDLSKIPGYQGTDIHPANGDDLTGQARKDIATGKNTTGDFITKNYYSVEKEKQNNPDLDVTNSSPVVVNSEKYSKQANQIAKNSGAYCLSGDCAKQPIELTGTDDDNCHDDITCNVASLSAIDKAAQEFDGNLSGFYWGMIRQMQTFKGKSLKCRDMAVNYDNCCSDKGWGQSIGLAGCNEEEKNLGNDKDKGLCVYIGEYCSHKTIFGICTENKKSYCCFDSMLSRIVQQQGRTQLGKSWGSKKSPDCSGLTPQDLQKIDFSSINFSEYYSTLNQQYDVPDDVDVQTQAEKDLADLLNDGTPTEPLGEMK